MGIQIARVMYMTAFLTLMAPLFGQAPPLGDDTGAANAGIGPVRGELGASSAETTETGPISAAQHDLASGEAAGPRDRELVVVSKTPEFFSYTLSTITILLSVLTILVGVVCGVGLTVVVKASRERHEIERLRGELHEYESETRKKLREECGEMVEAFRRTAYGLVTLQRAKRSLGDLLALHEPKQDDVYAALQKTVRYPDLECVRLYSKALEHFEDNVDIVRLVRNGLIAYCASPSDSEIQKVGRTN